jgi:hypothetical protein
MYTETHDALSLTAALRFMFLVIGCLKRKVNMWLDDGQCESLKCCETN